MRIVTLIENTPGDPRCACEHGLSLYLETHDHRLLMDTGSTGAFADNAEALGIDLTRVDTVVLSHGHYDHAGGLLRFAALNPGAPIYLQAGADGDFYHGDRYIGIDKAITALPQVRPVRGDLRIDGELFLFAGITGRRFWPQSNLSLRVRRDGQTLQDDFSHEQCLVVSQDGHRVLVSGCAHNGILNILDRYRDLFGGDPDGRDQRIPYDEETALRLRGTGCHRRDSPGTRAAQHGLLHRSLHRPARLRADADHPGGAAPPAAQRGGTGPRNPVKPLVPGCPDSRKTPLPLRCLRGGFLLHIFEDCVKFRAEKRI